MLKTRIASARLVPYSSIVGQSVMLLDDAGKCIGQLAVLGSDTADAARGIAQELVDMVDEYHRHAAVTANIHRLR